MSVIQDVRIALASLFVAVATPAFGATMPDSIDLTVTLVEDPDFPPLDERLVRSALDHAAKEYKRRFDATPPKFDVKYRFDVDGFLGAYANHRDPRCASLYAARYRGGGKAELAPHRDRALKFLRKWSIESLKGFIEGGDEKRIKTYEDVYDYYVGRYTSTVAELTSMKTPNGTPLVQPWKSAERSFVAWMCALKIQSDADVVITNTFILSDLLTEPHPHSVFGKAKIGGIAMPTGERTALGGQVLLATTFGIDTKVEKLSELGGKPATFQERAQILGAYLLAHEVAHAIFGIPDVFDHPLGCLMTSRPGATYRDGIEELDRHPRPCPRCQPYVQARKLFELGTDAYDNGRHVDARRLLLRAAKKLPKHFHGGRRRRISEIVLLASKASFEGGHEKDAKKFAKLAVKLNPRSRAASSHLASLEASPISAPSATVLVSRTSTTATSTTGR